MDGALEKSMFEYYDVRAPEFDDIYTLGGGPASIPDPDAYRSEVAELGKLVAQFGAGKLIDLACGTGFWLPHYAQNSREIVLLDQSSQMLSQTETRVRSLGLEHKCRCVKSSLFEHPFDDSSFDRALVGFILSHVTMEDEDRLFEVLKSILRPDGKFLIMDSMWSEERSRTRRKDGRQQRTLNDGRTFDIYKRYFDQADFEGLSARHGLNLTILHEGRVFIAAKGTFRV